MDCQINLEFPQGIGMRQEGKKKKVMTAHITSIENPGKKRQ